MAQKKNATPSRGKTDLEKQNEWLEKLVLVPDKDPGDDLENEALDLEDAYDCITSLDPEYMRRFGTDDGKAQILVNLGKLAGLAQKRAMELAGTWSDGEKDEDHQ